MNPFFSSINEATVASAMEANRKCCLSVHFGFKANNWAKQIVTSSRPFSSTVICLVCPGWKFVAIVFLVIVKIEWDDDGDGDGRNDYNYVLAHLMDGLLVDLL